ncbi:MAG: sigma-70 family RNA polymerase sigma factor [Acidobacteria bacterium]|nr:sigma-70 family RNA polymerase sigma factor [Acidobacteriota bacterium]
MLHTTFGAESLPSFSEVVENVRNGHPDGLDQLYRVFRILSGSLRRQVGYQDFEDRMHDMFIVVVEAIRDGRLREASALPSYIHGVARLSLCSHIGVRTRHERLSGSLRHWVTLRQPGETPEDALAEREREQIMRQLLASLSAKEREILTRFYIREQSKQEICRAMSLTDTQFRLTKSRAKQRLSRISQQHLNVADDTACAA